MLLALKNETLMRNDRCTPGCRLRRHTGRPLGGAWPRSSTTLGGGRFLWGRLPPRPRPSGRCPLRATPQPEGRTVPPPGGVPDSLSGRAIRLGRWQIVGRGGVRASVVPPASLHQTLESLPCGGVAPARRIVQGATSECGPPCLARAQACR